MIVVPDEPIRNRGLRGDGLESRMGMDDAGGNVESGIRYPHHACTTVVARYVLDQPVDRIPRVGALVDILRTALLIDMRPHVRKLPLRHESPAHVLVNEDVPFVRKLRSRTDGIRIVVRTVRRNAVGRSFNQERIRFGSVFWDVYVGEELNAISHRDQDFTLGVTILNTLGKGAVAE